jgi:HPt (histidine-containing phosphotransfer) domain-containing protein
MQTAPETDPQALPALLARLGAGVAADLHRQLCDDLAQVRAALALALAPPPDLELLARQAHALIALAGLAGAHGMTDRARRLHDAARQGDTACALGLGAALLPGLETLIATVAACPLP